MNRVCGSPTGAPRPGGEPTTSLGRLGDGSSYSVIYGRSGGPAVRGPGRFRGRLLVPAKAHGDVLGGRAVRADRTQPRACGRRRLGCRIHGHRIRASHAPPAGGAVGILGEYAGRRTGAALLLRHLLRLPLVGDARRRGEPWREGWRDHRGPSRGHSGGQGSGPVPDGSRRGHAVRYQGSGQRSWQARHRRVRRRGLRLRKAGVGYAPG